MTRELRDARPADADAVAAFTRDTWPDEPVGDYIPRVFEEWAAGDDPDERTLVAVVGGEVVGVCHATMLTSEEGWLEGIRVHPDHRGAGHGQALTDALLAWCRREGATVARNLVFDWNEAGLGQSRAAGFDPVTTCRWAHPEPANDVEPDDAASEGIVDAPAAAWRFWTDSDARTHLGGLAMDPGESWAVSELTRDGPEASAIDERVIALVGENMRGMAVRTRTVEREAEDDDTACSDGEGENGSAGTGATETVVEYGVAAWANPASCEALLDAIRADVAALDANTTRVLIPDTARCLSDVAAAGAELSDEALVVHAADLLSDGN